MYDVLTSNMLGWLNKHWHVKKITKETGKKNAYHLTELILFLLVHISISSINCLHRDYFFFFFSFMDL